MYGRKTRTISRLRAQVDLLLEQRDQALTERDDAVRLNSRLAKKVTDATKHADRAAKAWGLVVRDANQAEYLFARASKLLRLREDRRRKEIAKLREEHTILHGEIEALRRKVLTIKEQAAALDARVHTLTIANQNADWQTPATPSAA